MKELYELREKLCDELMEYGDKEMSAGSLDVVDKLAHAIKNIDKILEYSEGYSSRGGYNRDGYMREYSNRGNSRRSGRYSSRYEDDMRY